MGFSTEIIEEIKGQIRGSVILPSDSNYEETRKVYNGMIDKRPALFVLCANVSDVITSVKFAKAQKLPLAIRSGGHHAAGLGVWDDALVIDISQMKGIRVAPEARTVRVEGGCLLGDIDHATQVFGKAIPSGIFSTTGISGLTLGGGLGHLSRAYGLAIDSMLEADVVLADGTLVTASETSHPDLFWALRGGGGNFGVVTSFLFKLHDAGTVQAGPMLWHLEDAAELMQFYRDFLLSAPNEIYCYFAFLTVPPVPIFPEHLHLKKMCGLIWCNVGDMAQNDHYLQQFRDFKTPALDYVGPMPYNQLQSLFDDLYPKGLQWYWKGAFIKDLSEECINENVRHAHKMPTPQSTMHLYPVNGACHNKSNADTAWGFRDANWSQVIVGVDPDPANNEKITQWARRYWQDIHPYSLGGGYINFMMDEGTEKVKASYGDNYERLVSVKRKYDPENLFNVNQNIKP